MKINLLDRLIGSISPKAGAERAAWRQYYNEVRSNSYDAADTGRMQSRWNTFNESAEMTDRYERDTVRARARDLERNSDVLNAVIRAYRRNVISEGLQVRITTPDQETNAILEKAWERWCRARNCDVTGTQSFIQIIRMCIQRKIVDGGILILKRYTNQGFIPFQIQLIEVDELDLTQTAPKGEGNKVVGGIEYNRFNRAVGYYIRQYSIDGIEQMKPVYVEAKDVIYYFGKIRPSQIREMSHVSPSLTRIKDMNEFMTAVSLKEKIAACLAVFIKRINAAGGGVLGRSNTDTHTGQYQGKRIVPGMIMELNPGDEAQMLNPSGQGTDASSFIKTQQRMISSGNGLSYESISRDMSETNYSSARQSNIEDDLTYGDEREMLNEVLDEIYETFVISCWLAGIISDPDFFSKKEAYLSHEWVLKPKRWIDPYKEANANSIMLKTGQKTFQQICSENGRDWKQVLDEMSEANAYAQKKGIDLMSLLTGDSVDTSMEMEEDMDGKQKNANEE